MHIQRRVGTISILAAFLGCAVAQADQQHQIALSKVKRLKCTFSVHATGTWNGNGEPQAELKAATISVVFDEIDTDEGSARSARGFGPSDITVRLSQGTLHFMQSFASGAVYITSVFDSDGAGGKLKAVHSRHEFTKISLPGFTSRPEQHYGFCEPPE
jgi:hypothetical protein